MYSMTFELVVAILFIWLKVKVLLKTSKVSFLQIE